MEEERAASARKGLEVEHLRDVETRLSKELDAVNDVLRGQTSMLESLQIERDEAKFIADEHMGKIQQLQESKELAARKAAELAQVHQEQIYDLTSKIEEAGRVASMECSEKEARISELESRVEKLLRDRKEKAREFAAAQELSSKLMAVMGLKTEQSLPRSDVPDRGVDNTSVDIRATQSFESGASSKGGPTPKRTKPRRITRTPSKKKGKINLGSKTVKTAHYATTEATRQPFKDLGMSMHNRSPTKLQAYGCSQNQQQCDANWIESEDRCGGTMEFGDISFGGSDIFTSTEKNSSSDRRNHVRASFDDETTADF